MKLLSNLLELSSTLINLAKIKNMKIDYYSIDKELENM